MAALGWLGGAIVLQQPRFGPAEVDGATALAAAYGLIMLPSRFDLNPMLPGCVDMG